MTILTNDFDAATGDAYDTTGEDEFVVVAASVILVSDNADGIGSGFGGAQIVNYGTVTGQGAGLYFAGSSYSIIENEAGGLIAGNSEGIYTRESGDIVLNDGSITSRTCGIDDVAVGSMYIDNSGYIFGTYNGIVSESDGNIINSGTIESSETGISIEVGASSPVSLDNTGVIRGLLDAVTSLGPAFVTIANRGTIDGSVDLADTGGDTITNKGPIEGNVQLGNGKNTFNGVGGTVTGTITGGAGADTIHLGNDGETVNGGLGHDVIYGGAGADTFEFTSDGAANADGIRDFNVANDIIELSHATFTKLAVGSTPVFSIGTGATSASDHLYYSSTGGGLWYDPDGAGKDAAIEIANLGAGLKLTAKDFTIV
jgi:Ca2+-binding RTX toxin-like protein